MTGRQYGTTGLFGVGFFALSLVLLHLLDTEVDVVDEHLSSYALGDYGWLSIVGHVAAGIGTIAIALGLRATLSPGKAVTPSWMFLLIGGFGFLLLAVFMTDRPGGDETTMTGVVHDIVGYVQIISFLTSAWLLRDAFARDTVYEHLARFELWSAALITICFVLVLVSFNGPIGLVQRIFSVVILGWLLVLGANVRREDSLPGAPG